MVFRAMIGTVRFMPKYRPCAKRYVSLASFSSAAPFSRKKRNSEVKTFQFDDEIRKVLLKLETACRPMIELNEKFSVERVANSENAGLEGDKALESVVVKTLRGKFTFRADMKNRTLCVESYITGFNVYVLDPISGQWLSNKDDKHDMRGMVIRDFLRHCTGFPSL